MSSRLRPLVALATVLVAGCDLFEPSRIAGTGGRPQSTSLVYQVPNPFIFLASPVATDGTRLFAESADGDLVALSMETGAVLWSIPFSEDYWAGTPVYADGLVLAATDRARAHDAATGVERWSIALPSSAIYHVTATANGVWYVGVGNEVLALDVQTGDERWRQTFAGTDPYPALARAITVAGGVLYICGEQALTMNGALTQGPVVAMDATTGEVLWTHIIKFEEEYNYCISEPSVADDAVVVADYGSNNVMALDRATGEQRWHFRGPFGWYGSRAPPIIRGDTVFFASVDKTVRALDLGTGSTIWETQFDGSLRGLANCGAVLLANNFSLHTLDSRTGAVIGENINDSWPLDLVPSTRPVVVGDTAWILGWQHAAKLVCSR
ncbi:MAG: PQQ-binding-like beta-propeller repeat protein [Gemmatimonadaceae bacterium]|nr:PQQ-binding-like beta-propeller repeat protein [Gemmatimonadaceae bacterium]